MKKKLDNKVIVKKVIMAKVKYNQGLTLSKNYQSWRVDAGIELSCKPEAIGKTFKEAQDLVEEQLSIAVAENRKALGELQDAVNN